MKGVCTRRDEPEWNVVGRAGNGSFMYIKLEKDTGVKQVIFTGTRIVFFVRGWDRYPEHPTLVIAE